MGKISIILALLVLVGFVGGVFAQGVELPDPGLTPDSPFYFLEIIFEEIGTFFTFGDLKKAERYAVLAAERMAEAKAMAEKGKPEFAQKALERYGGQLQKALARAERAKNRGEVIEEVTKKVAEATTKHLTVLEEVLEKVPEEAKAGILKAKEVCMQGHKEALKALAGENPGEAMEIGLRAMKGRLDWARAKMETGKIEEARKAIEEFKGLRQFGEEISQIAQRIGKDVAKVEELVTKATSHHLEVLSEVYEKVPEEAKEAIEKAMDVSARGYHRAVEALKKMEALKEIPEEVPFPERIPQEIRKRIKTRMMERLEVPPAIERPEVPSAKERPEEVEEVAPERPEIPPAKERPKTPPVPGRP